MRSHTLSDDSRQEQIKSVLMEALDRPPSAREQFVRAALIDQSMCAEVLELIEAHEQAGEFMSDSTSEFTNRLSPLGELDTVLHEVMGSNIGRYKLVHLVGEGGFGRVYLAEQHEPIARQVALKIIKLGMDTRQVIARFEAERQVLAMMKHPSIATVFDAGATTEGRPYFVMEFVDGVAITEYCDQHNLTVGERLRLFIEVCGAVQHAHTKGVIHRDLKPSNLLVTVNDACPQPKVIDFGIAKATRGDLSSATVSTEGGRFVGTPQYMSPEQASENALDIDTRADVYSLGMVLYELLAGVSPFDDDQLCSAGIGEWQRIIREQELAKPSTRLSSMGTSLEVESHRVVEPKRAAQLRGDLDWITLKSLEKDRDRRYSSAAELAEDLRRHLNHEPVLASPPSAMYRVKKFVRRNRLGVLASCVIAVAFVGGAIGLWAGMMQARDSAEEAQAVNDFMQEVLSSVSPEADGADVRLVEVMDDASAAASQRFADHPLLEAQVRDLLGNVYNDLSMWSKAKSEFKRAMELWQVHLGLDDPRTLTSERMYVGSAINLQQIAEIESGLTSLMERMVRAFGLNALAALDVQRSIGVVHMLRGRTDEAERVFLDVRARLLAHGDDDSLQVRTLRSLIRLRRIKSFGADYGTRAAMVAQIETLAKELVERAGRAYGPASVIALDARVIWAEILADQRQYGPAAQAAQAVLDAASNRLGACHYLRMEAFEVLAKASHRTNDSVAAAELTIKRIACIRQKSDPLALLVAISDSLPILDRGERWIEGESLAKELVETLKAMGGGHGDMQFDSETWSARFVSQQGRLEEAEAMFQSLLSRAERADLTANVRARVHLFHGSNLYRRSAFEESEAEIQTAADTMDDFRMGTRNTNPDDILIEFIALYNAWGHPEKAAMYQAMREQTLANLPIDPT